MYLRRIDEFDYSNKNHLSLICCGQNCYGFHRKDFYKKSIISHIDLYYYYYYTCGICGTLYKVVFDCYKNYINNHGIIFQICFDDDNPELEIMKRYLDMSDNSSIFAIDNSKYKGGPLKFTDGSLKIITTNEGDVFAYGNNIGVLSTEEVVFGKG